MEVSVAVGTDSEDVSIYVGVATSEVAEVVERWQLLGAGAEHTAHCGTYSLQVDRDGQWQASCYRRHWKPWWRDR